MSNSFKLAVEGVYVTPDCRALVLGSESGILAASVKGGTINDWQRDDSTRF